MKKIKMVFENIFQNKLPEFGFNSLKSFSTLETVNVSLLLSFPSLLFF